MTIREEFRRLLAHIDGRFEWLFFHVPLEAAMRDRLRAWQEKLQAKIAALDEPAARQAPDEAYTDRLAELQAEWTEIKPIDDALAAKFGG